MRLYGLFAFMVTLSVVVVIFQHEMLPNARDLSMLISLLDLTEKVAKH